MKNSYDRFRQITIGAILIAVLGCQPGQEPPPPERNTQSAPSLFEQGRSLLFNARNRFQYADAASLLEKAVAEEDSSASAHLALAYAYLKRGNYAGATEQAGLAARSLDELGEQEKLWLPAIAARAADRAKDEINAWSEVVAAFPEDRWAWYELASANISVENFEASAQAAEAALEIEPDPGKWEASWIYYLHSKALFRGGYPKESAVAAAPGEANATTWRSTFFRMALGLAASGEADRIAEFVETYREISQEEGRNNPAMTETNISLFYYELGFYEEAATHAQAALDIAPGAYQSWALGYALIEGGKPDLAMAAIEAGLKLKPDDVYLNAARGWALYRKGDFAGAEQSLLDAQRLAKRRNLRVEQDLAVVRAARNGTEDVPAPKIRWLG